MLPLDPPLVLDPGALPAPPRDGRQSERALAIRRGTGRLLRHLGFAMLPEVTLASGRRADVVALSGRGEIWIVEIKSSVEDLRADTKWPSYKDFCDRLFFATHPEVPADVFPRGEGLIVSDGYAAEIVRPAGEARLASARRKAMTLRFAELAARRLHDLEDPLALGADGPWR